MGQCYCKEVFTANFQWNRQFFNNFEKELEGVIPSNIWNYEGTCLVDDPGISEVHVERGCKYPENM